MTCELGHLELVRYMIDDLDAYSLNNVANIKIPPYAEITKEEVIEMIKARDFKNHLFNEIQVKSIGLAKNRLKI